MLQTIITVWITGMLMLWGFIVTVDEDRRISSVSRVLFVLFWPVAVVIAVILLVLTLLVDLVEDFGNN